jgi:hypothetical protein
MHLYIYLGISWLVASFIIAMCGAKFRFGFWGYFFGSLLLTPLAGLLLLLAAIPPKTNVKPHPRS